MKNFKGNTIEKQNDLRTTLSGPLCPHCAQRERGKRKERMRKGRERTLPGRRKMVTLHHKPCTAVPTRTGCLDNSVITDFCMKPELQENTPS